ncbi:MAG: PQQ-binding-like beta-propeller repeat protein [Acidobacteria bacterium]|nr:PQQ-binding-like beta-propeller repeat protein [Acidobacteriota bacterium]
MLSALLGGGLPAGTAAGAEERPAAPPPATTIVYEGARLIAGDGAPPLEDSALVVSGGVISAVGPRDAVDIPSGAIVVDVAGMTIIPALVDLHGHVGFQRGLSYAAENYTRENVVDHLHRYAYYGVGTVVSLGTDAGSLWREIRGEQEAGTLGGARLFTAGRGLAAPNAGPGAAALRPSAGGVTSPEEGRAFVRTLAEQGVAFVKVWVDDRGGTVEKLAPEIYRAIIDEAHGLDLQVIAHVFYHDDATDLVEAGVDGFAHLVRDREMDETLVAEMASRGVFVMPNMGVSERGRHTRAPDWLAEPLLAETVSPEVRERAAGSFARRSPEAAARAGASYAAMERSLDRLAAAGVPLVLGSDSGVQDHFYGFAAHRELELMVAAGLSPMDAILTATSRSADRLGLDDGGRLAAGARADFLVLEANPLDDIANTRRIARVVLGGEEVDREALSRGWTEGAANSGEVAGGAPPGPSDQDVEWRAYAADLAGSRYAPLDQIDAGNVADLRIVWRQSTIPDATRQGNDLRAPGGSQNTPLMVGRRLFIMTALGTVAALDATTGEVVWFDDAPVDGGRRERGFAARGVAYWTDGDDARVVAVVGSQLVALNAETGERYPDFGDGGAVNLVEGYDDRRVETFRWRSAPIVVGDVVVVGSMIGDIVSHTMPALKTMPPGDVRGFDVRTGEQRWIFRTIPREGEPGNETWLTALNEDRASWEYTGNTNMWASPAADEELGYVYLPLSTPTSDYYGGHRPGDNLFAESLVCLDAATGERIWHFQAVHHGLWDYDFPAAPTLVDVTVDGRPVKAVAIVSKQAFTYVFDRMTGEPLWPIEERPVPAGDVPGEWYAATQPFPTKPPAYDQQGVTLEDLIDFTPELRQEALEILDDYVWGPLFTPPTLIDESPGGTLGTMVVPGLVGGSDWNGAGVDPETGILYVPSSHSGTVVGLARSEHPRSDVDWVMKNARHIPGPQGLPLFKPPYGRLVAIDLNAGDILWSVPNGDGPRDHPAIAHLDPPPLGHGGRAAPLVTRSLVFLGEGANVGAAFLPPGSGGKTLRAYDKATGDLVAAIELPGGTTAAPISYRIDGRQYIVVAIGWDDMPSEYVALALPEAGDGVQEADALPAPSTGAAPAGPPAELTLDAFRRPDAPCYDRSVQPQTAVVDTHLHFRPFGGPTIPFDEIVGYLRETGVLFANVYGIGQTLPATSSCTYYLDCPGTPVTPSLQNDLANAANLAALATDGLHLTLAMTFPDLSDPDSVLDGMAHLDAEHPGAFRWMGEVNLVKQALFANGHEPVPAAAIGEWAGFMEALRARRIPLAIHSDLGDDDEPTRYLPLMEEVLRHYPDNAIVWMHMGLSRELTAMDPAHHVALLSPLLDRHPNLLLDISWRVLDDAYFSTPEGRAAYVPFLNAHSERILPGTDFLASRDKDLEVYRTELEVTGRIHRHLDDRAFRNIALGENYFRLLDLDYQAPAVCAPDPGRGDQ